MKNITLFFFYWVLSVNQVLSRLTSIAKGPLRKHLENRSYLQKVSFIEQSYTCFGDLGCRCIVLFVLSKKNCERVYAISHLSQEFPYTKSFQQSIIFKKSKPFTFTYLLWVYITLNLTLIWQLSIVGFQSKNINALKKSVLILDFKKIDSFNYLMKSIFGSPHILEVPCAYKLLLWFGWHPNSLYRGKSVSLITGLHPLLYS